MKEIERAKGSDQGWWAQFKRMVNFGGYESTAEFYDPKLGYHEMLDPKTVIKDEKEILLAIADEASCVVAGRSGFYVFRQHPNHLSILIQASMDYRVERVMRKQGMSEDEARKTIDMIDKMRENYVKATAGTSRYDTRNYHLVISADGKTEEQIADLIMQYID